MIGVAGVLSEEEIEALAGYLAGSELSVAILDNSIVEILFIEHTSSEPTSTQFWRKILVDSVKFLRSV